MRSLNFETREGGVLLLSMRRPAANTFDLELMKLLSAAAREAARSPATRAIVLTGAGEFFSAGLDLKALSVARAGGGALGTRFADAMHQAIIDLWTCPRPTVAAVNGHAISTGFLVAAACDFRFVYEGEAEFGLNELQFGGALSALALELGRHVMGRELQAMVLSARLFNWRAGVRNGTFSRSFGSREQLVESAVAYARELGKLPREAYSHAKAQLLAGRVHRIHAERERQQQRLDAIQGSEESSRALAAYIQRLSES